jgi:tetratricopeptide (TPR) repeat protein
VARLPGRHVSYPLNFAILVSKIVGSLQTVPQLDALSSMRAIPTPETVSPEMLKLLRMGEEATIVHHQGDFDRSIRMFRNLLDFEPNYVAPRVNLAHCLIDKGDPGAALQELRIASSYKPSDVDVYMAMAKAYAYLLDSDNEIQMYEKVIQIDPHHFLALNNLGATYRDTVQLDASEQWLLKAKEEAESVRGNNEQRVRAYHNLALTALLT